jgi:hypothetical protein
MMPTVTEVGKGTDLHLTSLIRVALMGTQGALPQVPSTREPGEEGDP